MMCHISGLLRTFSRMAATLRAEGCPVTASRRAARRAFFVLGAAAVFLASPLPAAAQRGVHISYIEDPVPSFSIEDVASQEKSGDYRGYVPSFMAFSRLPGTFNGAIWLRITVDAAFEKPTAALTVNLGRALPGLTRLFIPQGDGSFNVMESAQPGGVFILPENTPFPNTLYARIDGLPGLWFKPQLEAAQDGAATLPLHFILAGVFALGMLILLGQYIRKAEEWRVWAAVTAGCGIIAAVLPPIPSAGAAFTPLMATGMLMPGLILTLFVHTVRHLFDSPRTMPGYDKILVLLYLAGGGIALLPLVPGFLWVTPYLPLAYIALLPLPPLAMLALARSLRGGSLFFCASLLPVAGVAASTWELTAPGAPWLAGGGGLWGVALAILLLSFVAPDKAKAEADDEEDVFDCLNRSYKRPLYIQSPEAELPVTAEAPFTPEAVSPAMIPAETLTGCSIAPPMKVPGDPHEPDMHESPATDWAAPSETSSVEEFPSLSLFGESGNGPETADAAPAAASASATSAESQTEPVALKETAPEASASPGTAYEDALPIPDSALEKYPSIFEEKPEPELAAPDEPTEAPPPVPEGAKAVPEEAPALFEPVDTPILFAEEEADHAEEFGDSAASHDKNAHIPAQERRTGRRILFNLPLLIKNAYDALAPLSEKKNIGMTWFVAPQTGHLFEGEAELLESALRLLLRDMVESVDQGNVRLNVRRLPDGAEGHLVFTVVEWDAKQASCERKIAGLAEAWSLAEKTGGIFKVEHSPSGGTTVIFSAIFTARDRARPAGTAPSAGLADKQAADERAGGRTNERNDAKDVPAAHAASPAGNTSGDLAGERSRARDPRRIIVADIAASSRARTSAVFAETPYSVLECASPTDALALYTDLPSALVVMNADMPEVDIIAAIRDIRANDDAHGRARVPAVALVGYAEQAKRLMQAGCTRTVRKNSLEDDLLAVVAELIPVTGTATPAQPQPAENLPPENLPEEAPTPETLLDATLADIPSMEPESAAPEPEAGPDANPYPPVAESGIFSSILPPCEAETPLPRPAAEPVSSGLGLLDMLVTDEDAEETPANAASSSISTAPAVPEIPAATPASQAAGPRKGLRVVVHPGNAAKPASTALAVPPSEEEAATRQTRTTQAQTPNGESVAQVRRMAAAFQSAHPAHTSIPLPGEEDSVFKDMAPLIPGLIVELADAMNDAAQGKAQKSPMLVQEAAERVAGKAESFGLARLERMARCVERAAAADDIEPMECVLADLEAWVARYVEALRELHRTQQW